MTMSGSGQTFAEQPPQRLDGSWGGLGADLDGYVDAVMRAWGVPGLAVAVVKDGKPFGGGFGLREVGRAEPVGIDTIFGIGSVTKTFTGLDVALLADRGLIDWDAPITRYLPDLRYADPKTTDRATVRDLAAHRVGVDSDLAWMVRGDPFEAIVARNQYIPPAAPFGAFVYSNVGYASLGLLVEAISGRSWDDFTQTEVFAPLGMSRSSTRPGYVAPSAPLARSWLGMAPAEAKPGLAGLAEDRNVSAPHGLAEDGQDQSPNGHRGVRLWPWRYLSSAAPAGSINSTARDLARYMLFQLGDGAVDGRRVISQAQLLATHTRNASRPSAAAAAADGFEAFDRRIDQQGYGLGWQTSRYRGRQLVHHAGGMPGYAANLWMSPSDGLGVAVLTNLDYRYNAAFRAVTERVFGHFLGLPSLNEAEIMVARWSPRVEGHMIPLPDPAAAAPARALVDQMVGQYHSDEVGELSITLQGGRLIARFDVECTAELLPTDTPGSFVMVFHDAFRWRASAAFDGGDSGRRPTLTLGAWSGDQQPHVFEKAAP